jgi:hypothetical protein
MTEVEFFEYCQSQVSGSLKDEDIVTMLTAWGSIKFSEGYKKAMDDQADNINVLAEE